MSCGDKDVIYFSAVIINYLLYTCYILYNRTLVHIKFLSKDKQGLFC